MSAVGEIIDRTLDIEGSAYTNDPKDSGGPTKWGITQATLSNYRARPVTPEDVENLTRAEAWNCYDWLYVSKPGFTKILPLSEPIAAELIDTGVNCGPTVAILMLQRLLNALNDEGRLYRDLKVDGDLGQATIDALRAYLKARGTEGMLVLHRALNCLQGERYVDLAEKSVKNERFLYGWLRARVGLLAAA